MKELNPDKRADRYQAAIAYAKSMKDRLAMGSRFEDVAHRLAEGWAMEHACATGMNWDEVREVMAQVWDERSSEMAADAMANLGMFAKPPTFAEQGQATPRNVDEPNR
ncbi:MAG TPA: hypothetical protein VHS31_03895 [Tepidisphaeraceae bacterium]|jgi:hypothetical protein|nr:hypothetical protein [Tepidisphaeraceae bacterium]